MGCELWVCFGGSASGIADMLLPFVIGNKQRIRISDISQTSNVILSYVIE